LINDLIAKGIDPKTLPIGAETKGAGLSKGARRVSPNTSKHFTHFLTLWDFEQHSSVKKSLLICSAEIARYFGSDATKSAIESVWKRQVRPSVKAITDALDQGGDPKDVNLLGTFWTGGKGASGRPFKISAFLTQPISFCLSICAAILTSLVWLVVSALMLMQKPSKWSCLLGSRNVFDRSRRHSRKAETKDIEINALWAGGCRRASSNLPISTQHVFRSSSHELSIVGGSHIDFCSRDRQVLWHQLHEVWSRQSFQERHPTQR
jgi:hypothetical protein